MQKGKIKFLRICEEVYCDNCGTPYAFFSDAVDNDVIKIANRVCDVCFLPMVCENPFYKKELKNER